MAKCPPARVAIQPPSVEYSNDCGKWRSVRPCWRSWSSSAGPVAPGLDARGARDRVHLEHAVERAQVDRDRAGVAVAARAARRRPPRWCRRRTGSPRRPPSAHQSSSALELGLVARVRHHVGRVVEAPAEARAPRRGRTCRARARRARRRRRGRSRPSAAGGSRRGGGSSHVVERAPAAPTRPARSRGAREPAAAVAAPARARAAGPRSPSPRTSARPSRGHRWNATHRQLPTDPERGYS